LREAQIKHYLPVEVDVADKQTTVAARFSNGTPWITHTEIAGGSLIWFATSCDDEDSNLPSRAAFLPLMQRIFHEIAQRTYPQNLEPGQPWIWRAANQTVDSANAPSKTMLLDAEGNEHSLIQERWDDTRQLGVYSTKSNAGGENATSFAVVSSRFANPQSASDSLLKPSENESLIELSNRLKAVRFENAKDFVASTRQSWLGREIWSWFWIGAVLCFLGEIFLEQSNLSKKPATVADSTRARRGAP
jgi:hypothetical protein